MTTTITNQAELDAAIAKGSGDLTIAANLTVHVSAGDWTIRCADGFAASVVAYGKVRVVASGRVRVEARGSAHVKARGNARVVASDSARVEAWDNAIVEAWDNAIVEAWDNAIVVASDSARVVASDSARVEAWDNAIVEAWDNAIVEAWDNAIVLASDSAHVEARGNARVEAMGHAFIRLFGGAVKASAGVVIMRHAPEAICIGGTVIEARNPDTPKTWCEHWGVSVTDGIATLYRCVDDDYSTYYARAASIYYTPGSTPSAPDWDGGTKECGGGMHMSPTPRMAREFNPDGTRYVACPVLVSSIAVHPDGMHPNKVKVPGVCGPIFEVDADGKPVEGGA